MIRIEKTTGIIKQELMVYQVLRVKLAQKDLQGQEVPPVHQELMEHKVHKAHEVH
jgi:hypothetical protein